MLALVALVVCSTLHSAVAQLEAANLLGSMTAQGVLPTAQASEEADAEAVRDAALAADEQKTTAVLAGDLTMDNGAAGSIGGIPEGVGQVTDEDWAGRSSGAVLHPHLCGHACSFFSLVNIKRSPLNGPV